jgi:hypothetical protein
MRQRAHADVVANQHVKEHRANRRDDAIEEHLDGYVRRILDRVRRHRSTAENRRSKCRSTEG